ncbi:MAG TPA: hypothetical protein VK670_13940 [Silvibacterium sp.]|nr:hypothetical protein [Silvibacterium sp.]
MSLRLLVRKSFVASFYGWVAGLAASLPFQVVEGLRASGSAANAAVALLFWTLFSLLVSLYFCAFFVIPIGWMVPSGLILGHRLLSIASAGAFGVLLAAIRLHIWTAADHDGISPINFFMWAAYSGAFFLAASTVYTRYARSIHGA